MKNAPMVRFPVNCPVCRAESLRQLPANRLTDALIARRPIKLYATCHEQCWNASAVEVEQIRQYAQAAQAM